MLPEDLPWASVTEECHRKRTERSMLPAFRVSGGLENSPRGNSKGWASVGHLSWHHQTSGCVALCGGRDWLVSGSPLAVLSLRGSNACLSPDLPASLTLTASSAAGNRNNGREGGESRNGSYSAKLPFSPFFVFSSLGLHSGLPSEKW